MPFKDAAIELWPQPREVSERRRRGWNEVLQIRQFVWGRRCGVLACTHDRSSDDGDYVRADGRLGGGSKRPVAGQARPSGQSETPAEQEKDGILGHFA
jgi:hypothetical protein